ncbi:MAG: hypothetical protein E3J94_07165 [Desulfobacteraceae bacterium]|nr:MAG: hypothetical protein E3J94_07165 [Desulfobacteraceae bacterium]
MKNRDSFDEFMAALGDIYDKEITEFITSIYWRILEKYSDEQCNKMFNDALITFKFFPKPVELIELITGGKDNLEDKAQVEALKVLQAIRRIGGGDSVIFEDPVTTAVIKMGFNGWVQLTADLLVENEKWFAKDFCKIYETYARQGIKSSGNLAGIVEMDNIVKGYRKHIPESIPVDKYLKQIEDLRLKDLETIKQRQIEHGA